MMEGSARKQSFFNLFKYSANERKISNIGLGALYRKELADNVRSKRFYIILVLALLISAGGLYCAISGIKDTVNNEGNNFIFLKLFTTSAAGIPSFIGFIALLGPFIGLMLGFDSISGERSRGTLNRLVSQPIYRDSVIIGKLLGGVTIITVMVFSMMLLMSGVGLFITGVPPSLEEIVRIIVFMIFTIVYISMWMGLAILFSVLFRHSATSALLFIAVWLFLAIFIGLLANGLFPVSDNMTMDAALTNYNLNQAVNRISPLYLYSESINMVMSPGVATTVNLIGPEVLTDDRLQGIDPNSVSPLGQSMLMVWPHLTGLLALTMISFAVSYIFFMRQEIRAG